MSVPRVKLDELDLNLQKIKTSLEVVAWVSLPSALHSVSKEQDALRRALILPDVMETIAAFQNGIHLELLPLAKVEKARLAKYAKALGLFSDTMIQAAHKELDPWYEMYGTTHLRKVQHPLLLTPVLAHAIHTRQLDVLRFLHESHPSVFTPEAMDFAARIGALDVVEWLHCNRCEGCSTNAMDAACQHGHLAVVAYLHTRRQEGCTWHGPVWAATRGDLPLLGFLLTNRPQDFTRAALIDAVKSGHVAAVELMLAGLPSLCDSVALEDALNECVLRGDLAMLALFEARVEWTEEYVVHYLDRAVVADQREVISHLFTAYEALLTGCPMDVAAKYGYGNILRWLDEQKESACTTGAMDGAAANGHLDLVMFLDECRSEGCSTHAMDMAATNGHLDVVEYLHSTRREGCTTQAMDGAASNGHLDVVEYLHTHRSEGCTQKAIDGAAKHGHLDVVQFLWQHRSQRCSDRGLAGAIYGGHVAVLNYCVEHDPELFTPPVLEAAAETRHAEVVEWLKDVQRKGLCLRDKPPSQKQIGASPRLAARRKETPQDEGGCTIL
ncbi:unnamed protein product [Aphanomyces euteiches]